MKKTCVMYKDFVTAVRRLPPEIRGEAYDAYFSYAMDGDRLIYGDKFNKRLKRACETLDIKYRPSHQIRFTNAYALYEGGVSIGELSAMMGHTNTGTTLHYLRKRNPNQKTSDNVRRILSVV